MSQYEQLGVNPALPGSEQASITILYPNDTRLTITGDPEIVKQVIDRLDKHIIEYTKK